MNQSKGPKIFKKGKSSQENSFVKSSNYGSKIKAETSLKMNRVEDENWIGSAEKPEQSIYSDRNKSV